MTELRLQAMLVAGVMALSGCTTIGARGPAMDASLPPSRGQGAVASTIIAAMGDGLLDGAGGAKLGGNDRRLALEAEYRALEYTAAGKPVAWQGSAGSGEVIAAQPYRVGSQDCRQYTHAVTVDGQKQTARGTACRNADGSWTPLT